MACPLTYVDTSAYLAILLDETEAKFCRSAIGKGRLCSSTLLAIEAERAVVRVARQGRLQSHAPEILRKIADDAEKFVFKDLSIEICLTGIYPAVRLPRSSDLAHLRTALWFQRHAELEKFVTLDRSQAEAASELNLPVVSPELAP